MPNRPPVFHADPSSTGARGHARALVEQARSLLRDPPPETFLGRRTHEFPAADGAPVLDAERLRAAHGAQLSADPTPTATLSWLAARLEAQVAEERLIADLATDPAVRIRHARLADELQDVLDELRAGESDRMFLARAARTCRAIAEASDDALKGELLALAADFETKALDQPL